MNGPLGQSLGRIGARAMAGRVGRRKPKVDRDLSITKKCDNCGKKYHPRNNSYQHTSRFCTAKCTREYFRKSRSFP